MKEPDPISVMLADGWVARHSTRPKVETAEELLARLVRETRTEALDRALANLGKGIHAREADIVLFRGDPHMHLRYLDAFDDAVALHGEAMAWEPEPDPDDEGEQA